MGAPVEAGVVAAAIPSRLLVEIVGDASVTIHDLTHDSRDVRPGVGFACVVGGRADGHDFAAAAVDAGAAMLLVDRTLALDVPQIVVTDVRRAMGPAAAAVHGHPSRSLRLVGITGTNGKTTTTQMLGAILRSSGFTERTLGTLSGTRTTPEAPDLQRQLAGFVSDGVDAVVMEVSSHAMVYHRVAGTEFDVVVFTNLGRDHLDLHESMESYFRAKASLFDADLAAKGAANVDDPYGQLLLDAASIEMTGFGRDDVADLDVGVARHEFTWRGQRVHVPIGGDFNVMNSLAALTAASLLGVAPADASTGLATVAAVPGRFETVSNPCRHSVTVVVDYAHTPDGLERLLEAARAVVGATGALTVVFGCGGNRDRAKRPAMGSVASRGADHVVVTSDNPRNERPEGIIDEVVGGVDRSSNADIVTVVDRRQAIAAAIAAAGDGDVVVIAGKGHESTQEFADQTIEFDDRAVARVYLEARP